MTNSCRVHGQDVYRRRRLRGEGVYNYCRLCNHMSMPLCGRLCGIAGLLMFVAESPLGRSALVQESVMSRLDAILTSGSDVCKVRLVLLRVCLPCTAMFADCNRIGNTALMVTSRLAQTSARCSLLPLMSARHAQHTLPRWLIAPIAHRTLLAESCLGYLEGLLLSWLLWHWLLIAVLPACSSVHNIACLGLVA